MRISSCPARLVSTFSSAAGGVDAAARGPPTGLGVAVFLVDDVFPSGATLGLAGPSPPARLAGTGLVAALGVFVTLPPL
jgi:hypothetical protein